MIGRYNFFQLSHNTEVSAKNVHKFDTPGAVFTTLHFLPNL